MRIASVLITAALQQLEEEEEEEDSIKILKGTMERNGRKITLVDILNITKCSSILKLITRKRKTKLGH